MALIKDAIMMNERLTIPNFPNPFRVTLLFPHASVIGPHTPLSCSGKATNTPRAREHTRNLSLLPSIRYLDPLVLVRLWPPKKLLLVLIYCLNSTGPLTRQELELLLQILYCIALSTTSEDLVAFVPRMLLKTIIPKPPSTSLLRTPT